MADTNNYIKSTDIKVYPTSKRNDAYDRNARLSSEQNLISVVNRLTSKISFVIDGLTVNNQVIQTGSCNIHGYLFTLTNTYDISSIAHTTGNDYLVFEIKTKSTQIESMSGSKLTYEELVSFENDNSSQALLDASTDITTTKTQANNSTFSGLKITTGDETLKKIDTTTNTTKWRLIIAKWDTTNSEWVTYEETTRTNLCKLNDKDIQVNKITNEDVAGTLYNTEQDLQTWLRYNYIIDDGRIE